MSTLVELTRAVDILPAKHQPWLYFSSAYRRASHGVIGWISLLPLNHYQKRESIHYSPRQIAAICLCPTRLEQWWHKGERQCRHHISCCECGFESVMRIAREGGRVAADRSQGVCRDGHCEDVFRTWSDGSCCGFSLEDLVVLYNCAWYRG